MEGSFNRAVYLEDQDMLKIEHIENILVKAPLFNTHKNKVWNQKQLFLVILKVENSHNRPDFNKKKFLEDENMFPLNI